MINSNYTATSYKPDGAQVLSIIGGEADGQFPGGYAPKSELFYYGGGDLFYEDKQYQSIYQAFHKEKVRLLYHGIPNKLSDNAAKKMAQSLLMDMMDDNKTLIIWPAGDRTDVVTSYNADILLNSEKKFQKGYLIVAGYHTPAQALHLKSKPCGKKANSCLMADFTVPVPYVPGAVDNIETHFASGTRFSAAIVTGIAAQVLQQFPWMDGDILRQTLLSTAQRKNLRHTKYSFGLPPIYQGYSNFLHGWGLINLSAALKGPSLFDSDLNLNRNKVIINVDDDSGNTYTFSNNIRGDSEFDKTGEGILELSGKNQFQGNTSVREGVLKMTGSLIHDPRYHITVYKDATLELTGTVSSSIIVKKGGLLILKDGAKIKKI